MISTNTAIRLGTILGGLSTAGVTAWGAYEAIAAKIGGVSYLLVAAPLVVFLAAFIPPIAERYWRDGMKLKAAAVSLVVIPVLALAWYGSKERVGSFRAEQAAVTKALKDAVTDHETNVTEAKAQLERVRNEATAAKKLKSCKAECLAKHKGSEADALSGVETAQSNLTLARTKAVDPAEGAPEWLLPFCGELMTFALIWIGFAPRAAKRKPVKAAAEEKADKPKRTPRQKMAGVARKQASRVANDNVVTFPARA